MDKILHKPTLICYDWDNTLVDTNTLCIYAFNTLFTSLGMPTIDQKEMDRINGFVFEEYLKEIFGSDFEMAKEKYRKIYSDNVVQMLKPLPYAIETVRYFHGLGVKQVVISNKHGYMIRNEAERMGFSQYIEKFFGMDDSGIAKPDVRFFDFVLNDLNLDKKMCNSQNTWFFGDSSVDIQFSNNINTQLFFVGPKYILEQYNNNGAVFLGSYTNVIKKW